MQIGSLFPGRVPNSLVSSRLINNLESSQSAMTQLQDQISTGHKFQLPSDNPTASITTAWLQQALAQKTQSLASIGTNSSLLNATSSALSTVNNALNSAKSLALQGVGDSSTPAEKTAIAQEVQSLIQQLTNTGNTSFEGRYLFAGTQSSQPPFAAQSGNNFVSYSGDTRSISSYVDTGLQQANNLDGNAAFGTLSPPLGRDLNPALKMQTQLSDLNQGAGVNLGSISVSVVNGSTTTTHTIDLSQAKTVQDIQSIIQNAFTPGTVTVTKNAAKNGLLVTPASGTTVAISDVNGGTTAADLGIAHAAAAVITGTDLNPRISLTTLVSALNGGTGIGSTAGTGLQIINGGLTHTVNLSSAVTVEDVINTLKNPDLGLAVGINAAGNGLAVSSRLSGADLFIGENGGTNATNLGIRTFTGSTALADLNYRQGVPISSTQPLTITRRNGTTSSVDLTGAVTVQDVLTKINAVNPGHLVASLASVGNGISITDDSGAGPLSIASNTVSDALGISGTEPGSNPAVALAGRDVNPQEVKGVFNALVRLQAALQKGDNNGIERAAKLLDTVAQAVNTAQGDVGTRIKSLTTLHDTLSAQTLQLQSSISDNYDTDMSEVVTQLVALQTSFQATLQSTAKTLQVSLYNYL